MKCHLFYVAGLLVAFAYDDLSHNKVATQSHTWTGTMYDASMAVDGNQASCIRTEIIGISSPEKTVWWKVDLGGVYNIYSVNIMYKNYDGYEARQRGRFAGFSLYVSNTGDMQGASLCYKDGPQLPPLNFTCICTESGRYVIYYNERFDEVTYPTGYEVTVVSTELCEITVQGCDNANVYGINCDKPCPTNCKDNTCHIQSGQCLNCKTGWTGMHCNIKCGERWYGENCSQQCAGHCRDGATCNHVTGRCEEGCVAGWTGLLCNKSCDDGTYGYNCNNNCSGHCFNGSPCNKQTGHCDMGCKPGYTSVSCNKGIEDNFLMKQNMPSCITLTIGLAISLLINLILIGFGLSLCRRKSNRVNFTGCLLFSWNKSVYQDTVMKTEEVSTYQELDLSGGVYQNTTIQ